MSEGMETMTIGEALKATPPMDPPAESTSQVTETAAPAATTETKTEVTPPTQTTTAPPATTVAPVLTVEELQKRITELETHSSGVTKAMIAERNKRQESEAREAQLQQKFQVPAPNYYENPEQLIEQRVSQVKREVGDQILQISETMARQSYPDYDDKYQTFQAAAVENPALLQTVMASHAPAVAAYQIGKQIQFNKKYGTEPEQIVSKVKEELSVTMRKEIEAEILGKARQMVNQPTNILAVRSAGGDAAPDFQTATFKNALARPKR